MFKRQYTLRTHAKPVLVLVPAIVTIVLGGCISSAGIVPQSTLNDPATLTAERPLGGTPLSPAAWPKKDWWNGFGDTQLDGLITEALTGSPTLSSARARVDAAVAAAAIAGARLGISNEIEAEVTRQRNSARGAGSPNLAGRSFNTYHLSANFSIDPDFWDRNREALNAALGRVKASEADAIAARLALSVAVARTYIQLAHDFDQLDIDKSTIAQRESVLTLARERLAAGLDSLIDIKRAESEIPLVRAQVMQREEAIALGRHQLAALMGKGPDRGSDIQPPRLRAMTETALPSTLPADLVGRRPDVVASRWRIEASRHDIESAKAAFLPNVNLAAYVGVQSIGFANLLRSGSQIFGLGPAVHLPIFGGTTLRGTLAARDADYDLAVEQYNQILVDALREVVDQVTSLRSIEAQRVEIEHGFAAADDSHQLILKRYHSGLSNRLVVLSSEMQLTARKAKLAELRARHLDASVSLIRALGGGFEASEITQAIRVNTNSEGRKTP